MASVPKHDKWILLARKKSSNTVQRLWTRKDKNGVRKWKRSKNNPNENAAKQHGGGDWHCRIGKKSVAEQGKKWAEKEKSCAVYMSKDKYPFTVLPDGGVFGDKELAARLNKVGRDRQRYIRLGSFKRPPKHSGSSSGNCGSCQHCLYIRHIEGWGNLAAKCSCKYSGKHSHSSCDSCCSSHHCKGLACDSSYYKSGRSGSYVNLGNDSKCRDLLRKHKLVLNVGGEPWHVVKKETDSTWRA